MTIAAYVRVSSKAQSLASQRDAISRVAKQRGDTIRHWYSEKTSTRNERPELVRLRNDARAGLLRKLYVFRLDRLSRGTICEAMNLLNELKQHGCRVETIGDGFDMLGPAADIVAAVLAWAANWERQANAERISAARARMKRAGKSWGRPTAVSEANGEVIASMRRKRISWRVIAERVKLPSATVYRYGKRVGLM